MPRCGFDEHPAENHSLMVFDMVDQNAVRKSGTVAESNQTDTQSRATAFRGLSLPAQQGAIAFLIYLIVWVVALHKVISRFTQMVLNQRSQDPNINVWSLRWWPYAIGHGLNPLYSHEIMAPAGHSLAWVTTSPPLAVLLAPLTLAASPVVTFNLLAVLALPLSAWAAYLLCRRLAGSFWAGLAGGAVFGFSAYEMKHTAMGQLNLAYTLLLPILAYIIVTWWQGRISNRTFVILAALTLALQFYEYLEIFADMTGFLALGLLVGFAVAGKAARPVILRLGKHIGLAYLIAIVLALPYLLGMLGSKPPRPLHKSGMDLASLVIPQPGRTFGISWLAHAAAGPDKLCAACYVGIPLLVLAVLLAVFTWQSGLVRFLCCMLVIILVAALGPELVLEGRARFAVPWAGIFHLPLARNAYPLRMMVFAYLILAVAVAVWLAGPAKQMHWGRWSLVALVILFAALDAPPIKVKPQGEVPAFIRAGDYRRDLSPGEIVVVASKTGNAGMLWQAETDYYMRIAGGYINQGINHRTDLPRAVQGLIDPTALGVRRFEHFVQAQHVGAILVDAANAPAWAPIFRTIGLAGHKVGGVVVYQTDGCRTCRAFVSE